MIDQKILIIIAILVVVAVVLMFGGDMVTTTTTTTVPQTTTTQPSATTTTQATTTTTVAVEGSCNEICVATGYDIGNCRPACLSYETENDNTALDCTEIQKCCCK